jgi:hypothetical protein
LHSHGARSTQASEETALRALIQVSGFAHPRRPLDTLGRGQHIQEDAPGELVSAIRERR